MGAKSFQSLHDFVRHGVNIDVGCANPHCDHRGVVDAVDCATWFRLHRWPDALDGQLLDHFPLHALRRRRRPCPRDDEPAHRRRLLSARSPGVEAAAATPAVAERCRLCSANDREALIDHVAGHIWESRRHGSPDDVPWAAAGGYWQRTMRELAIAAIDSLGASTLEN